MKKTVYFYKENGSPITERIKTAHGYKDYHNYELHEGDYKEGQEVTFHVRYGRMETYVVEAVEGNLVLMRRIGSSYKSE